VRTNAGSFDKAWETAAQEIDTSPLRLRLRGYGYRGGYPRLRQAIASYLGTGETVRCLPELVTSAYSEADAIIGKPFDLDTLDRLVQRLLASHEPRPS
jgi:DNA-binding transcriptional MocR family regulator